VVAFRGSSHVRRRTKGGRATTFIAAALTRTPLNAEDARVMTAPQPVTEPAGAIDFRLARRLLVSRSLFTITSVLGFIPLPGMAADDLWRFLWLAHWSSMPNLSIGAIGIAPIMTGFVVVEFAALIVPRWRHLSVPGGRAGARARRGARRHAARPPATVIPSTLTLGFGYAF
jgi:preprotein translocase subunit SecY